MTEQLRTAETMRDVRKVPSPWPRRVMWFFIGIYLFGALTAALLGDWSDARRDVGTAAAFVIGWVLRGDHEEGA